MWLLGELLIASIIGAIIISILVYRAKRIPCPACGSFWYHIGYWNRAWNTLCNQAAGAWGRRCDKCGHIMWNEPSNDKWLGTQPNWIKLYKES